MGATVTYQGKSSRVPVRMATRGARFLPLRHTNLTTGGFRPASHDYIELFLWRPAGDKWSLDWFLLEVIRERLIGVAGKTSLIAAATPSDARDSVTLRVNQDGNAEFSVQGDARSYTEVLVSETEKEDDRERDRARSAADARVDWDRVRDPQRPPSLLYADSSGCADILLYGWSDDRTEVMTFRVDDGALHLPRTQGDHVRHRREPIGEPVRSRSRTPAEAGLLLGPWAADSARRAVARRRRLRHDRRVAARHSRAGAAPV